MRTPLLDETFATPMTNAEKLRLLRWIATASAVVAALSALILLRIYSPVWQTWLFDVSIASVFAATAYVVGRRLIAEEARERRRILVAIVLGITCTSAALGVFAITLAGQPAGLRQLPALVVIQLLGALGGAALGFVTSLLAAAVVRGVSRFFACSKPTLDGAVIGALSGTLGGVFFLDFPHLSWWFLVASAGLCSLSGTRAAAAFETQCPSEATN